jgi:hypothetical protein
MKYAKISLSMMCIIFIVELLKSLFINDRTINSALVWFVQYPLFLISIVSAIIVLFYIKSFKSQFKEIFMIAPALMYTIYCLYVILKIF